MFFVEVSDVVAGNYPSERNFRIGGLVVGGSLCRREPEGLHRYSPSRLPTTACSELTGALFDGVSA